MGRKKEYSQTYLTRALKVLLIVCCALAFFSSALPYMTIHMTGIEQDITVYGISEFFTILSAFDLNKVFSAIHLAPLAQGVDIGVGRVSLSLTDVLSTLRIDTVSDVLGDVSVPALPIGEFVRLQKYIRALYGGCFLAVLLAISRRSAGVRVLLGAALCAAMFFVTNALSEKIAALPLMHNEKIAQTLSIYPDSIRINQTAYSAFMVGMGLYVLVAIVQMIDNKRQRMGTNEIKA